MHLANQAVLYDGMEDFITDDSFDHTGALYCSIWKPTFKDDGDGNMVKVSDETVLIEPDSSIWARHTFAGWNAVGTEVL